MLSRRVTHLALASELVRRRRAYEVAKAYDILPVVSDIMFLEWDPIGVNTFEQCRNEYEGYVPTVVHWLLSGIDECQLSSRLRDIQRVAMGMTVIDEELHRRVARRLLGLLTNTQGTSGQESSVDSVKRCPSG